MEGFVGSTVWSGDWSQKFPINPGLAAGGGEGVRFVLPMCCVSGEVERPTM